ncbi:MAG: PilZ domain-containing protein [Spirochaetales bacterium]|nr:PilZ domain-containing protein [Spirochaetales bacterium]
MWIVLLVAALLITVIIILRRFNIWSFPWIKFFLKGKESGFSFSEINLLRKVAIENKLKDPTSLFWSIRQLDFSIRGVLSNYRARGIEETEKSCNFISKLFEFRKRVEFQLPKYKLGLKSTRDIPDKQKIKISIPGMDPFYSQLLENLRRYMAFSYPQGPKLPAGFSWKGQQIGIYFYRNGDAGYFFNTKVIDDFYYKKYPILHVAHSSNLVRSQKRKSIRVDVSRSAMLFPLKNMEMANEEIEVDAGLRCKLIDLSEDGAAVLIGGRAKAGLPVKIQFNLFDVPIVMNGIVKGINFDDKKNRSIIHIQALPLSNQMRNQILIFVYNIFGERAEDTSIKAPKLEPTKKNSGDSE